MRDSTTEISQSCIKLMARTAEIGKSEIGQKLMSLHEGVSRVAFAERLGISDSTLGNYERGERFPDATFLARLRAQEGVDLNWLLSRDAFPPPADASGDQITVPRYDIRASAGRGALVISENAAEYLSIGRDWLRRNLPPWAPSNAVVGVLEGGGDSMEPTIRDGDLIMVVQDVDWRIVERGGIFVFSLDRDRLLLKRLQVLNNGDLRIISDNRAYEPETVPFADVPHRIIVHGHVFFVGGKPR